MAKTQKLNRIFAILTALLLAFMLIGSVALSAHHHHDDHHHEENCVVCQLIEATIATLRHTLSIPLSDWSVFALFAPVILIASPFFAMIIPDTLVEQKTRCDN